MQIFAINKMDKRQDIQLANGQMMMIGIQLLHLWVQIDKGGGARRMTNLTNRLICKIKGHKLFMLDIDSIDIQYDQYTGLGYVYCVRCKAYLPTDNLD
jgi:hypothetical protein